MLYCRRLALIFFYRNEAVGSFVPDGLCRNRFGLIVNKILDQLQDVTFQTVITVTFSDQRGRKYSTKWALVYDKFGKINVSTKLLV